jgi:hypothetical protein
LELYWSFSSGVGLKFAQPFKANGKKSTIPEETYQTLLTNKKQKKPGLSTRRQHY